MEDPSLFQGPESSSLPNDYNQINSALLEVSQRIQHFLVSSNASQALDNVYDVTDLKAKSALIAQDSLAKLNLPQILVLSEEAMEGATGAYSAERNTIYLTESLLEPKQDNLLKAVLVEEMGHFFDTLLNPGKDSPGDEGEFFQSFVMGNTLSPSELQRIGTENDWSEINVSGTRVQVEQNDTRSSATYLGYLYGRTTTSGSVSSSDLNDYYRFIIDDPLGNNNTPGFALDLTGMSADADVQLQNSSGSVIASSGASGSSSESIRTNLGTGTYYVRVYRYSGSTSYNLELRANRAGSTLSNAASIGNLTGSSQSVTDYVGDTSISDYYRFTLDRTSTFNLSLSGMSADADVRLLSSSGSVITSSSRGGSSSESISRSLSSGTYYINVYRFSSNQTNYNLSVSGTPVDNAGNSLGSARNIGTLTSSTQTYDDFVGSSDTNDYYRFDLSNPSNFNLSLYGMSSDADVQLLNSSGSVVASSNRGGSSSDSISQSLSSGTYYVLVYRSGSSNTGYNLSLGATAIPDNAGNTLTTARNVGTLGSTQTFNDFVGIVDPNDYYRFNLSNTRNFSLALSGLSADANVQLLNASGNVVASSSNTGSTAENISSILTAGTYYVSLYPNGSVNTNYSLSLGATAIPDNAGNTLTAARNIGALTATQTFSDFVGSTDTNDYYRFNLSNTSNVSLALNNLTANADVQILDFSGAVIATSATVGSGAETLTRTLNAGTYYVRIYPFDGTVNTNYNFSLGATILDNAGNTLPTARNIGALSSTQTFNDFVGSTDTNDYYRFNISNPSTVNLALNGMIANADVQLLNSTGGVIASSTAAGSNPDNIISILNPGTYYVRVYPFDGNNNTGYNLSLGATIYDGAGNTLPTARNIGVLAANQTFSDFVGSIDTNDYYSFSLNNPSNFTLALNGMTANGNVQLLDTAGSVVASSTVSGSIPERISSTLDTGIYYVRVYPFSATDNTNYNLTLGAAVV